jgi:hypothetical protein
MLTLFLFFAYNVLSHKSLADKFRIKGHVEFANELLQKKNTFLDASKEISSDKANVRFSQVNNNL